MAQQTLREKEAILRSVLTNLADAVIVADRQNRYLVYNPASERMFGKPTPGQHGGRLGPGLRVFPCRRLNGHRAEYLPLARTIRGEEVDDLELLVQMPTTAQNFWISVNGTSAARSSR